MQHLARTDRIYVENVGDSKSERNKEMNKNEKIQIAGEDLNIIGCDRNESEAVTGADAMMLSKDSLDILEERGMLKLDQSLKVEACNVDIKPKLGSELDRMEMVKLEHNLDVNQKLAARRNLSFRSKKQATKTQSIDSAGILGTELEKKILMLFEKLTTDCL